MKKFFAMTIVAVVIFGSATLCAGTTKAAPSGSAASINVAVSQKLQGLALSKEDYGRHKRAIDLLVGEGYETLAERYFLQEALGESIKTDNNQKYNEHNESL